MNEIPVGFKLGQLVIGGCHSHGDGYAFFTDELRSGESYVQHAHNQISAAMQQSTALPIVRFADGEFAFYDGSPQVNGLYQQVRNANDIISVLPAHIAALHYIAEHGFLCPIIYHNFTYSHYASDIGTNDFLKFLKHYQIILTKSNYIPFFCIYTYLTSKDFMQLIHNKNVLILSSSFQLESFTKWTAQFGVIAHYKFVPLPHQYMATDWSQHENAVLTAIKEQGQVDIALVGAGAGAALVCADVAFAHDIPVIDAGHVINLMNNEVYKSNGHRSYTFRGIYA